MTQDLLYDGNRYAAYGEPARRGVAEAMKMDGLVEAGKPDGPFEPTAHVVRVEAAASDGFEHEVIVVGSSSKASAQPADDIKGGGDEGD